MKSKTDRKKLIKMLDKLVSEYIRNRDMRCVICHTKERLTNGHLFSRTHYSTRWDVHEGGNCACQCGPCNMSHEFNAGPFTSWYINKFGIEMYDTLLQRHNKVSKLKDAQLEVMIDDVKCAIELLPTSGA